jgi:hypothetical protein
MDQSGAPEPDLSRLWNEKEAARFLGLSQKFLQSDRAGARRIPFIKIGSAVRYDPADVKSFTDRCKVRA